MAVSYTHLDVYKRQPFPCGRNAGYPPWQAGEDLRLHAGDCGGAKTIAFGDFSYYWIADRQGRSFKRLNELYAANGQVGFLGSQRVDGKLVLSEAVKAVSYTHLAYDRSKEVER